MSPPSLTKARFFGAHAPLAERHAFAAYLAPLRRIEWVVYAKRRVGPGNFTPSLSQIRT